MQSSDAVRSSSIDAEPERLHQDLGWKRLNPRWAKIEILGGLLAATIGLLCGVWASTQSAGPDWAACTGGVVLTTLGGYLALAGHRSHLYQSQTTLTAYLLVRLAANDDPLS